MGTETFIAQMKEYQTAKRNISKFSVSPALKDYNSLLRIFNSAVESGKGIHDAKASFEVCRNTLLRKTSVGKLVKNYESARSKIALFEDSYAVNLPILNGIDRERYEELFGVSVFVVEEGVYIEESLGNSGDLDYRNMPGKGSFDNLQSLLEKNVVSLVEADTSAISSDLLRNQMVLHRGVAVKLTP